MYAVVRCRSKAVFERLRDDLIQRGQKCHSLRIDTEHESMLDDESLLDSEIDTQELFNGETADFPEENGGVSALDLLGEAGGQEEDKEDQEFDDEMPFLEAKPRTFHTEPEIEPTKTTSTTYSINCRICTQSIRYKPETEWSQKCNHVLQHLVPVRYECPYCGQQEKIKGVLYDHLVQTHNEGIMAIPIPTVRELSEAKRFLVQLEQCFPDSEQFSLAIPDDHLTADIHDVIYYKFVLKSEMPRKYMKQAPVRLKCAKCNSCISKGPMEEQLKFEHALNHSHLTWITCSKCQATFTEKDSFFMHNRAIHHGGGFAICKERDDLSEENQIFVEHLVVKLFPTVIPTTLAERAPPPILLAKKTGPPQRKSRLRQVLPIEMENQGIVHVKQEERPSLNIFDTQEVKLENDADVTKRRSLRKRKLVAT